MDTDLPSRAAFFEGGLLPPADLSEEDIEEGCAICIEPFFTPAKTPCGHIFDLECAKTWFDINHTCPFCRHPVYQLSQVTPILPVYIEAMDLDLSLDEAAVMRSVLAFDAHMQVMDGKDSFVVPPDSQVLVNQSAMIFEAAGAAIWLKPNLGGGDWEGVCRQEWIQIVNGIAGFLSEKRGEVLPAEYFKTLLS